MALLRVEPWPLSPDFVKRLRVRFLAPPLRACFREVAVNACASVRLVLSACLIVPSFLGNLLVNPATRHPGIA